MDDQQVMHAMGIDDAYRVERVLASGAGGTTELVTLDGSGPFVRKRIPSKLARRGVWALLGECDCPRLPRVVATYEMPDEFVVVCDYVPGENLEELVATRGRLGEGRACELVAQLCDAAAALHARGIIHRDISPRNVVVAADGAHLIDLGIARLTTAGATHDTTQLGTPGFASPEQHGFAQTDARSDVYSIGRVLGYLLTGALPDVPEAAEYERLLTDDEVVAPEVRVIVQRATAMEPSARYQSAAELAAALRGEPVSKGRVASDAPRATASPTVDAAPRRRWPMMALAATAVVSLLAAIALLLVDAGLLGAPAATDDAAGGQVTSQGEKDGAPESDDRGSWSGAPASTSPESVAEASVSLEVVESGWSADDQGFVHYGIALRNTGDAVVEYPAYTVTGRDESGAVLFSQEQVLSSIGAGETIWWGDLAGNPGQPPATVEFSANGVEDYQVGSEAERSATFAVSGARPVSDGLGGTNFVGEVTCERDDGSDIGSDVALSVLLRDEDGNIVFGAVGFASRPDPGSTTTFEVSCHTVPDYASYEVHALAW
ncbi:serine/threonine protein kinase [Thermophilibacter mediterraneus]|uniref:serine/threonine protein kinase n=1 Tax=Thermophilibacter mediterraneus TaxID=1871031 RepID=UPI00320A9812